VEPLSINLIEGRVNHSTERIAELIWTVDVNLMKFLFGSPENWHRLFAIDWCEAEGALSHSNAVVAIEGDQVLGVLIGYRADLSEHLWESTLTRWFEIESPENANYLKVAFDKMDRLFPHAGQESFYILDLAVDKSNQKSGVGRKLMEWVMAKAKSHSLFCLELDVEASNPAVGFYKKLGMDIEIETLVPDIAENHNVGRHFHMKIPSN
jgi:ribosomal protein S18 acetylase RimI-like enzyme